MNSCPFSWPCAPFANLKREAMSAPFASAVCCGNSPHTGACGHARLEKRTQAKAVPAPRAKRKRKLTAPWLPTGKPSTLGNHLIEFDLNLHWVPDQHCCLWGQQCHTEHTALQELQNLWLHLGSAAADEFWDFSNILALFPPDQRRICELLLISAVCISVLVSTWPSRKPWSQNCI